MIVTDILLLLIYCTGSSHRNGQTVQNENCRLKHVETVKEKYIPIKYINFE